MFKALKTAGTGVLCFVISLTPVLAGVQEGFNAFNQGDYDGALKEFSALADKGDEKAMLTIGTWYLQGEGFKQDYGKAMDWYLRALEKGNPDAMNNLAIMYRDGLDVPVDFEIAYALLKMASVKARNDAVAGRVGRNMDKLETWISGEQVANAEKLTEKDLTREKLQKFNSEKRPANGIKIGDLMPKDGWEGLSKVYTIDPEKSLKARRDVEIAAVLRDYYTEFSGGLGLSSEDIKDIGSVISNGVYFCREGRFSIAVPPLSRGSVEVHVSKVGRLECPQVRFFEKGVNRLQPWEGRKGNWEAVAVATVLPQSWKGGQKEAMERIRQMQEGFIADVPSNLCHHSQVTGKLGEACQVIVLNRISSALYPQTEAKLSPLRHGLTSIGVNRTMYIDRVIMEFGIIVARPAGMDDKRYLMFAVEQMDNFMSGFNPLPLDASTAKAK